MTTPIIRGATADDYGTFTELFPELAVDDPVFPIERFVAEMVPTTLIAERGGRAAGYAFFRPMKEAVHLSHIVTAPGVEHALSLLRALKPFARPEDSVINVMVEDHPRLAQDLVRAGATLKLETAFMRGSLT